MREKFGNDLHPGDCFANNSGYHGNTHCGDFTLCAPIFFKGRVVFFAMARAHLADIGFPTPTTYGPLARDVYEEGLIFPCVRIQREGRDITEVIDICKANIRAPEQFYGDYLACLAAVRTGEKGVLELCTKYGVLMIIDEVKTGFRVGKGGAQALYGVQADIFTVAKAMANGYPISAIGGKEEILRKYGKGVAHGGTYTAQAMSLAAAEKTLQLVPIS